MNADEATPRVGFAQLKNMIGRRVLFVGRVEAMEGGLVRMAAPDGSKVSIQASGTFETPFAEVQGVVVDPQTIREESHVSFGENFGAREAWKGPLRGSQRAAARVPCVATPSARAPPTPGPAPTLTLDRPTLPGRRILIADMNTYNELLKLVNGPQSQLFQ
jgi:hypothetical protein